MLLVFFLLIFLVSDSQKLVSMEDFEDNKESNVGKTIKIKVGYNNRANGCQLRVICAGDNVNMMVNGNFEKNLLVR